MTSSATGARRRAPLLLLLAVAACARGPALAVANDNRTPAGEPRDSVHEVVLDARPARWKPDDGADSTLTVQAFAESDGVPRIPGPLIRVAQGTAVRVTVINSVPDSTLVLHGIEGGRGDSVVVPAGERREVRFTAEVPGTFLYWATTSGKGFDARTGRDAQLTGAIVVDPAGTAPDTSERIFVITMMDVLPDTTRPLEGQDDIFDLAVNGKSWPHTERLRHATGDTVRWRWVNGGQLSHPMHLHGFHFRVLAKGSGSADTVYAPDAVPSVVTELMRPRSTFRMEFVPTRAGQWLFHCHMVAHIAPFPERPDSVRAHGLHGGASHPLQAMSGLVLGIEVTDPPGRAAEGRPAPVTRQRLYAQEVRGDSGRLLRRGFVLDRGGVPRADSVEIPGAPLLLTRGERAEVTVVNRLSQPTSVHWHGMELDAYYDGVAGWSGAGARLAPMVAPGDSFTVAFTPPRAGTFMYHTHMEEEPQLTLGMFGPMLVLEPGERFDPETDLVFILGDARTRGAPSATLNGRRTFEPRTLRVRRTYRLRFLNILAVVPHGVEMRVGDRPLVWVPLAKDGADLPPARRAPVPAKLLFGVGETYDFLWTPAERMDVEIVVKPAGGEPWEFRVPLRVRP